MNRVKWKLDKEVGKRAMANNGKLAKEDYNDVFPIEYQCGYGIYGHWVVEENGEYFVKADIGSSCD